MVESWGESWESAKIQVAIEAVAAIEASSSSLINCCNYGIEEENIYHVYRNNELLYSCVNFTASTLQARGALTSNRQLHL